MKCSTKPIPLGQLLVEKNSYNISPPYQREGGAWSLEKKQLFIDSLLNGFDIPKVYLHDLENDKRFNYSVIDGKQRLTCIWDFLDNQFSLASKFRITHPRKGEKKIPDFKGRSFRELDESWQESLKAKTIDAVLVRNVDEQDIEELFSRLNNGEPLNGAEKRNAFGGDMCGVIREVSGHKFFTHHASFKKERYISYEVATKIILFEENPGRDTDSFIDTKKADLDKLVLNNKKIDPTRRKQLISRSCEGLNSLSRLFSKNDPLLKRQTHIPMYYLFIKRVFSKYACVDLVSRVKKFLTDFARKRVENSELPEVQQDNALLEFGRLIQQGTNDSASLKKRVELLQRYFLLDNPNVSFRDTKRLLSYDERFAVWVIGNKVCKKCNKAIGIEDMDADHVTQWAHGGPTTVSNAHCLCKSCNIEASRRVK